MLAVKGSTLFELMIGLLLGATIILGAMGMVFGVMRSNTESLRVTRMDHELRSAIDLISKDLRRYGYWGNAVQDLYANQNTNPFHSADNQLVVNANCILFSYDVDEDGTIPSLNTSPSDERFGYRLADNAIQSRPSYSDSYDCDDPDDEWEAITNNDMIRVTNLRFSQSSQVIDIDGAGSGTSTITVNRVDITMTAELVSDSSISRTLTESVRIRNDVLTP